MVDVLAEMAILIACGVVWRVISPGNLGIEVLRGAATTIVYYLFLPALVLRVIWQAPLGLVSLQIAVLAAAGVLTGIVLGWLAMRLLRVPATLAGAVILASAWPNASYLGLPVLDAVFGELGRSTAIQYDLFACTPLLLSLGILIARHYGDSDREAGILPALLRVPPLWAALLAVTLNLGGLAMPAVVEGTLTLLGNGVVPLMLLSLGFSLQWQSLHWRRIPPILPVLLIQLVLMPLLVALLAGLVGLQGQQFKALVLEASLPSMVLGLVICDRYRLDTATYAAAVTLSTLASLVTMPLWFTLLDHGLFAAGL